MRQKSLMKFLVILAVSLFVISCFAHPETNSSRSEPRWVAQPMHIIEFSSPMGFSGYSPNQVRAAYGLPSAGGNGSTIAIIDAYYTPAIWNDLALFSSRFQLAAPTISNFVVYNMSTSTATADTGWATETTLDVEWAHAIAPDAKILLVEATDDGNGLIPAISFAASYPGVVAVSMSWGSNEYWGESQYDSLFSSANGTVFFASSGDNGAGVIWPACSPNVVAVGGTTLSLNLNGAVNSEVAWSGSGGGKSRYEPMPSYQTSLGLNTLLGTTRRAVPDVSFNANPSTGVAVCYNSTWEVVGGTSIGAPQWAAIQALNLSAKNTNFYDNAETAYSSYFRDITSGSNGRYNATTGYDLVTGLGSPLTDNFTISSPTPSPTPTPTPTSTSTPSATPTPSPSASPTPTATPTPNPTPTATPTPAPTSIPPPTASPTPSPAPTNTPTPSPALSSTDSPNPASAPTPTPTDTPLPEPTTSSTSTTTANPTQNQQQKSPLSPNTASPSATPSASSANQPSSSAASKESTTLIIVVFTALAAMTLTLATVEYSRSFKWPAEKTPLT